MQQLSSTQQPKVEPKAEVAGNRGGVVLGGGGGILSTAGVLGAGSVDVGGESAVSDGWMEAAKTAGAVTGLDEPGRGTSESLPKPCSSLSLGELDLRGDADGDDCAGAFLVCSDSDDEDGACIGLDLYDLGDQVKALVEWGSWAGGASCVGRGGVLQLPLPVGGACRRFADSKRSMQLLQTVFLPLSDAREPWAIVPGYPCPYPPFRSRVVLAVPTKSCLPWSVSLVSLSSLVSPWTDEYAVLSRVLYLARVRRALGPVTGER